MLRRVCMLLIAMCLVVAFCGCTPDVDSEGIMKTPEEKEMVEQNDKVSFVKEDGRLYIIFNEERQPAVQRDVELSISADYPEFATISEMKEYIERGDYTDSNSLRMEIAYEMEKANKVEICNIEKLHDITLPMGFLKGKFSWGLDDYSVTISDGVISGIAYILDRDSYEFFTKEENEDVLQEYQQILSDELVLERDARVVHYKNQSAELKRIHYTLENNGTCLYIYEVYTLQFFYDAGEVVSETIPQSIRIAGENDDGYFYVYLSGFKERPSVEWLSSFGIVDYVEESTEAAVK